MSCVAKAHAAVLCVLLIFLLLTGCSGVSGNQSTQAKAAPPPSGGGGSASQPPSGPDSISHVIVAVQENRSFDNYFGLLGSYRRARGISGDIAELPLNVTLLDKAGHPVQPFHFRTACHENVSPAWNQSLFYWDNGKMDNFMHTATPSTIDPDGTRAMGYYDSSDLPYYYALATAYATSDKYYSSVMTETVPNRMYIMGATSWGAIRFDGPFPKTYTLIFDRLTEAGVHWKYYLQDKNNFLAQFPGGLNRYAQHFAPISQYFSDLADEKNFPQVAFIERAVGLDEHPGNNVQRGAADMKVLIDSLMQSPVWPSSAFVLTYDEGGGMYDHVPPVGIAKPDNIPPMLQPGDRVEDFNITGFRVPLIVISPWVKPHFVSHVARDHTSILKMIEDRFHLRPLTNRDAAADDMAEFFDFQSPIRQALPSLPAQPINEPCDYNLETAPGH